MHTVWQKEIISFTLIILFPFIITSQKNPLSGFWMIVIGLLFILVMFVLWYLAGSKQYWIWRGYDFAYGNITAIERVERRAGRINFLLKPGTNEFVNLAIEIEFMNADTIAETLHTHIWVREFYRYLADIKTQNYQYRTPDYHVGDTVEIFFKETEPTSIRIW